MLRRTARPTLLAAALRLAAAAAVALAAAPALAQKTSSGAALKGTYVEVGVHNAGYFGMPLSEVNALGGYHGSATHNPGTNGFGFIADYRKNGWTGQYGGDYFTPGTPYEGFSLDWNGGATQFSSYNGVGTTFTNTSLTYASTGGAATATWTGDAVNGTSKLRVIQTYAVGTGNVYFTANVQVINIGTAAIPSIRFARSVDPDNEATWNGGYDTTNTVVYQEGATGQNRACVTGTAITLNDMVLGLGAIDARAKVRHGYNLNTTPIADMLAGSSSGTAVADAAIGIIFELGTLNPGQSTSFDYAYILSASDLGTALGNLAAITTLQPTGMISGTSVPFQVKTNDMARTSQVDFYVNGVLLGSSTTAVGGAFSYTFDSTAYSNGNLTLRAVATINGVQVEKSSTVVVDNSGPPIAFTTPTAGQAVTGDGLSATVVGTDAANPPTSVTFYREVNGTTTLLGTVNAAPFTATYNTSDIGGGGLVAIRAYAVNAAGRSTTAVVSVFATSGTAITVTPGTTSYLVPPGGTVTVDPNVTVLSPSSLNQASVTIGTGFVAGEDVLAFTPVGGITGSYSAASGVLSLTGTGTAAEYQAALRSVTYTNTAGSPTLGTRQITFGLGSGLFYPGTGHFYEFVSASGTWGSARTAAAARSYFGLQGYLATITSAGENTFISTKVQNDGWIGAQASGTSYTRTWSWVTGPESGTTFCSNSAAGVCTSVSGRYSNWAEGEPNNSGGNETVAELYSAGATWNDLSTTGTLTGYMVEYGGMAGDPVVVLSGTRALSVSIPTFTLTFQTDGSAGASLTGATSQTIGLGGNATAVTAVPPAGWVFVNWTGTNGFATTTANPLTVTDVQASQVITAHFSSRLPTTTSVASSAPGGSAFGEAVTFTATVAPAGTGTVQFRVDGADVGSPVAVSGGAASFTTSSLAVGAHTIVAVYAGDATHYGSTSAGYVQAVGQSATSISLLPDNSSPTYPTAVTLTATVAAVAPGAGAPSGAVAFQVDGADIAGCTAQAVSGGATRTASCTAILTGGLHTVTASYSGDTSFSASGPASAAVLVGRVAPAVAVTSGANPSVFGQGVTFTATIGAIGLGAVPTGLVTFLADGNAIAGCVALPLDGAGQQACTTAAFAVGAHAITVSYGGDGNYTGAVGGTLSQQVDQAPTTTVVVPDQASITYGTTVTLTATVSAAGAGAGAPGGTVRFQANGVDLPGCGARALAGPGPTTATCAGALLPAGTNAITALYSGDPSFTPSASASAPVAVARANPPVAVISDKSPTVWGEPVTLTATVGSVGAGGSPTGTVDFLDAGVAVAGCLDVPLSPGPARCVTAALEVGLHSISVQYSGDANHLAPASAAIDQQVDRAATSTSLQALADTTYGTAVTLTATVAITSPGAGTVGGTVTFTTDGGAALDDCPPVAVSGGVASCTTTLLPVGAPTTVTATASGDAHFVGSADATTLAVDLGTSLVASASASPSPSTFSQLVTFDVDVQGGGVRPTGTFTVGNAALGELCRGTLSGGLGACGYALLPVGSYVLDVAYLGDANYQPAASVIALDVLQAPATLALASSANPSTYGGAVTFTALVGGPGGVPGGAVTFADGGVPLCGGPVALDGAGLASCTLPAPAGGAHAVTADYAGDATYLPAAAGLVQVVERAAPPVTLASDAPAGAVYGAPVTFTFQVAAVGNGAVPAGAVRVLDGATTIGSGTLDAGGTFQVTRADLEPGAHAISAVYQGSGDYLAATSATVTQAVAAAPTAIALSASPSPSEVGQPVTLSVTVTAAAPSTATPGTTVQLFDGGASIGYATLSPCPTAEAPTAACGTLVRSDLAVGEHALTAALLATDRFAASSSAPVAHVVNPPSTTTDLVALLPFSTYGDLASFRVTTAVVGGSLSVVTGDVEIYDGADRIGQVTLAGGTALFTTSTLAAGSHDLTARYVGTGDFKPSTSAVATQVVEKAQPRIDFRVAPNPSVFGQAIALSAVISTDVVLPGGVAGLPAGELAFEDVPGAVQVLSVQPVAADGSAGYSTAGLSAGPHHLRAHFRGAANYKETISAPVTQVVEKAPTAAALAVAPAASVYGQAVTLTATLSVPAPGAGTPTGLVTFLDRGSPIGTGALDAAGATASLTVSSLAAGAHLLAARYEGDGSFATSTSALTSRAVDQATVQVSLTSDVNPSAFGQAIPLRVGVAPVAPGAGTPTGLVAVSDGARAIATLFLIDGRAATTVPASALAAPLVGAHALTARYLGDASFAAHPASAEGTLTQTVAPAATTTTVAAAPSPSTYGQAVTFTAAVAVVAPGTGTPGSGTVTFSDGATPLGAPVPVVGGVAALTTTAPLAAGAHTITASYAGDPASFAASSGALAHPVAQATTELALATSPSPSMYGQPVTVTVTGRAAAPGAGLPTGPVTITADGVTIGAATFDGAGRATLQVADLAAGARTVGALYQGDGNFRGAVAAAAHTVEKGSVTVAVTSSRNPSRRGRNVAFTATVASPHAQPGGAVTFKADGVVLGRAELDGGVATYTDRSLVKKAGPYEITAEYAGDDAFAAATGALADGQVVENSPPVAGAGTALALGPSAATRAVVPLAGALDGHDLTLEAWAKAGWTSPEQAGAAPTVLRLGGEGVRLAVGFSPDRTKVTVTCADQVREVLAPVDDGGWHHLAVTLQGGRVQLFVDGLAADAFDATPAAAGDELRLGEGMVGAVDEVRAWSVVRTAEQLRAGAMRTIDPAAEGLAGAWRLDEASGAECFDATAAAHDGAVTLAGGAESGFAPSEAWRPREVKQERDLLPAADAGYDVDGDALAIGFPVAPAHGAARADESARQVHYRAGEGYLGADTLTFRLDDGEATSEYRLDLTVSRILVCEASADCGGGDVCVQGLCQAPDAVTASAAGCGCTTGNGGAVGLWALLALAGGWRRRRKA